MRTCRWCGKTGHNRATCPRLKEYTINNPNSWEAKMEAKKQVKKSCCSYCNVEGHKRTKCQIMESDKRNKRIEALEFRHELCNLLSQAGIAPGCLLSGYVYNRQTYNWDYKNFILKDYEWEDACDKRSIPLLIVDDPQTNLVERVSLPELGNILRGSNTRILCGMGVEFATKWNTSRLESSNDKVLKNIYMPYRRGNDHY